MKSFKGKISRKEFDYTDSKPLKPGDDLDLMMSVRDFTDSESIAFSGLHFEIIYRELPKRK